MSAVKDKSIITKICFAAIFAGVIITFGLMNKNFLTINNFITILKNVSAIGIAALGLTFVIAVGHTDMSFYLVGCFSAMFMAWMVSMGLPPVAAILIALGGAFGFALASGIPVGVFRMPDMLITIAIGTIAFGCAYLFSDGQIILLLVGSPIGFLNDGRILGLPCPVFLMILLFVIFYIVLEKTKHGTFFYATGSNEVAARFSGINTTAIIIAAYVICVVLSSFAGMISVAAQGMGQVSVTITYLMPCFTAVFIGKAIFKRPNVIGTFLGALLVQIMSNGILLINQPYYVGDLITCGLLILSLVISTFNNEDSLKLPKIKVPKAKAKGGAL